MVALKPASPEAASTNRAGKQERRGGIETDLFGGQIARRDARSRNAVVALKPMRRNMAAPSASEAGTPWWH